MSRQLWHDKDQVRYVEHRPTLQALCPDDVFTYADTNNRSKKYIFDSWAYNSVGGIWTKSGVKSPFPHLLAKNRINIVVTESGS